MLTAGSMNLSDGLLTFAPNALEPIHAGGPHLAETPTHADLWQHIMRQKERCQSIRPGHCTTQDESLPSLWKRVTACTANDLTVGCKQTHSGLQRWTWLCGPVPAWHAIAGIMLAGALAPG